MTGLLMRTGISRCFDPSFAVSLQTSTNVQVLKQTSVTPTLCVLTRKDSMSADVLVDIRAMVQIAQVRKPLPCTLNANGVGFCELLGIVSVLREER